MNNIHKYFVIFLLWISVPIYSQLSHGGKPLPYSTMKSSIKPIVLSGFDMQQAIDESLSEDAIEGKKPLRFAWNHSLELTPENSGVWSDLPDGSRVWRIHLISPGAYGVNVDFSKYQLKPGCQIFIYPPSQKYFFGGFNFLNNNESGMLPTDFVTGEEIVVELQTETGIQDFGNLEIGTLAHAYIDVFNRKESNLGPSGSCNVDINCPEGVDWQVVKRSVCRITIKTSSGSIYCTGTLINNVKQDTIPYLLTANHCIRTISQANSALFVFNYEVDTCKKTVISSQYSLAGSALLATSDSLDFTLLRLYDTIPSVFKPYFAGWSISQFPSENSVTIHHPEGDVKKISIDNDPLTPEYQDPIPSNLSWLYNESVPQAFWRVIKWETGTTEGGSSGAPLFNQNRLIVGNLTGGQANCLNPVNDYFSKFHMCWDFYSISSKQLKYWLDPKGTVISSLQGFSPSGSDSIIVDTIEYADRYSLFPNPASGLVTFETDSLDIAGGLISVYSLTGKKILEYEISSETRLTFNVSFLEQGLYILEFSKGYNHVRKRLLIINPEK